MLANQAHFQVGGWGGLPTETIRSLTMSVLVHVAMAMSEVHVIDLEMVLDSESELDLESEEVRPTVKTISIAIFVSVLDRLKAPKASDLSRKQKISVNYQSRSKRSCKSTTAPISTVTMKAQQCVAEFSGAEPSIF